MKTTASAPAKIILLGEHAVVYGIPAIALPVPSLRAFAKYKPSVHPLIVKASDLGICVAFGASSDHEAARPLALLMHRVVDHLNLENPTGDITITSDIPISSGLGSSAAVAAAVARAIAALHHCDLAPEALNRLVYESERIQHGRPSGIDNTVVVYERPICFQKGVPPQTLHADGEFNFLIADSGQPASTREAVGHVRQLHRDNPAAIERIFAQIGETVNEAKECLKLDRQARLGELMTRNQQLLQELEVSSPALDNLVSAALEAGALGAKLSGGGRGGNMVALSNSAHVDTIRSALLDAGAQAVRYFVLQGEQVGR